MPEDGFGIFAAGAADDLGAALEERSQEHE